MSARRSASKASSLTAASEVSGKADSRLDHVLSIGLKNMSINKTTAVSATDKKADYVPTADISVAKMDLLHENAFYVSSADIGVNWAVFSEGDVENEIKKYTSEITRLISVLPNINKKRDYLYGLEQTVMQLGNTGSARPDMPGRPYYIYLLQTFAAFVLVVFGEDAKGEKKLKKHWRNIVRRVDSDAQREAENVLHNPSDKRAELMNYFNDIHRHIFNYGRSDAEVRIDDNTPKLGLYLKTIQEPDQELQDAAGILRGVRESPEY